MAVVYGTVQVACERLGLSRFALCGDMNLPFLDECVLQLSHQFFLFCSAVVKLVKAFRCHVR